MKLVFIYKDLSLLCENMKGIIDKDFNILKDTFAYTSI